VVTGDISLGDKTFQELVLQINKSEPTEAFAKSYIADAQAFLNLAKAFREELVTV
jgi:sulfite reductase (ferredoxin)